MLNQRKRSLKGLNSRKTQNRSGFSLVETLVGVSLMGVVLVPALFLSSSYFLGQLNRVRQGMEVSHSASQFLNRFMEEMYQTTRIINTASATSDDTHLYFAYYDTTAQREVRGGYQLRQSGGKSILEKLNYSTSSEAWEVISPYGESDAQNLLLPASAKFTYCQDSGTPCTETTSPEKALLVRLSGWTFQNPAGSQSLDLPDVDVYISAGAYGTDSAVLSEKPKLMYTINAADAFGSSPDTRLLSVSPFTGELLSPAVTGGGSGVLTTIRTHSSYGGTGNFMIASDGRLYASTSWGWNSGDFFTWHPSTGVSVILSNKDTAGDSYSLVIAEGDGRIYFGQADSSSGNFYTWHPSTGLTTIVTGQPYPGAFSTVVSPDGRVYFGNLGSNTTARFLTYKPGAGLTTILQGSSTNPNKWLEPGRLSTQVSATGRVYFGSENNGASKTNAYKQYMTWAPTDPVVRTLVAMTTVGENGFGPGRNCSVVNPVTGGIYFCDGTDYVNLIGRVLYWDPATPGVTTVVNSSSTTFDYYRRRNNMHVDANGRLYFDNTAWWYTPGAPTGFWSWAPDGSLTTIPTVQDENGNNCTLVTSDGSHVFFCNYYAGQLWDWNTSSNTSTLIFTGKTPGKGEYAESYWEHYEHPQYKSAAEGMTVRPDGRLFFTDDNSSGSGIWTWRYDTGLSTILAPVSGAHPGQNNSIVYDDNGRVYFPGDVTQASNASQGKPLYTWHETTGLSTIMGSGINSFATFGLIKPIPGSTGGVCFQSTGTFNNNATYCWTPGASAAIKHAMETGAPNAKSIALAKQGGSYIASAQDTDGIMYFLDSTNKTVDRYIKSSDNDGNPVYNRASQFDWSTWATNVGAIALDESTGGIALLDTDNKKVDIYANRNADGTPSAPSSFSVSGQAALPTGLAVSNRTGNYLVLDSTVKGSDPDKYITLNIYSGSTKTFLRAYDIVIGASELAPDDASAENNFKIALDNRRNILYLTAPSLGKIFAFSMPEYL
jgi:hypothetical protein